MTGKPQQIPPLTCPYGNKAGLVIMTLGITGRVQPKTGLALYDVHLPLENGKFKKQSKAMTLQEASTAAATHEAKLGWDKLPARVIEVRPPDPAVMAQKSKSRRAEQIEAIETDDPPAARSSRTSRSTEGKAGASRARAQPKASERGTKVATVRNRRF